MMTIMRMRSAILTIAYYISAINFLSKGDFPLTEMDPVFLDTRLGDNQ